MKFNSSTGNGDDFWKLPDKDAIAKTKGFSSFYDYCCQQKNSGCGAAGTCDPECTMPVQNRIRHLSSDVGFYLKWETDAEGYPTKEHCDAFKDMGPFDYKWKYKFKNSLGTEKERIAGCPMQDMDDGTGQESWKTVEMYADNNEQWIEDFVDSWDKMSTKGYSGQDLVQGPSQFWTHWK